MFGIHLLHDACSPCRATYKSVTSQNRKSSGHRSDENLGMIEYSSPETIAHAGPDMQDAVDGLQRERGPSNLDSRRRGGAWL